MASLWSYISSLLGPKAPDYGQPISSTQLPAAQGLPQLPPQDPSQLGQGPSTAGQMGLGRPSVTAGLPQLAAPPPAAPSDPGGAGIPTPPMAKSRGELGDALDSIFLGGALQHHAAAEYQRQVGNYNLARSAAVLAGLPERERVAAIFNGPEYGKALADNFGPHPVAEGATERYGDGSTYTAPKVVTDNGRINVVTPGGAQEVGNTGPSFNADGIDTRGLAPQANFNKPAPLESTIFNSGGTYQPGAAPVGLPQRGPGAAPGGIAAGTGAATGLPQLPGAGQGQPAASAGQQPRGLRNNNPGNVRALPNGQKWQGQTGVDDQGYATFGTSADGIRATLMNLHNYGVRHGIDTPAAIAARWAPAGDGNDPNAYAAALAQAMGVKPADKVDLNDPETLKAAAQGIFSIENGKPMPAPTPPQGIAPVSRSVVGLPQMANAPSAGLAGAQQPGTAAPAPNSGPLGLPVQGQAPTGQATLSGAPPPRFSQPTWNPQANRWEQEDRVTGKIEEAGQGAFKPQELRKSVEGSDDYKEARAAQVAFKAMISNADKMTGPSAYSMLDTFARAINPGAVARPQVIQTIEANLGLPAQMQGSLMTKFGQGNLPPTVRKQILDAVGGFVRSHWDAANAQIQSARQLAQRNGINPDDVAPPLEVRPGDVHGELPPKEQLRMGDIYLTGRGPATWNGQRFIPYGR